MKLVDILARELAEWPGNSIDVTDYCVQSDKTTQIFFGCPHGEIFLSERGENTHGVRVTRAEWQAAVDALNAPKVVELVIDWSKQPEGFPLWLEGTNKDQRNHSGWYRDSGQIFEGADGGQWRACRQGQFFTVHRKPESPISEWDGASLPSSGDTLEYKTSNAGKYWCKAIVKFVGTHFLLVGYQHPDLGLSEAGINHAMLDGDFSGLLRKIRTAEQVAAEEREKAIQEMISHIISDNIGKNCADLYDAGYRKEPKPCGS